MQTVKVMNASASSVPFLGLGAIDAGDSKTGSIPTITFDANMLDYIDRAANIGVAVRDLSGATAFTQTGYQLVTAVDTVDAGARTIVCTTAGNYVLTLVAANSVDAGTILYFFHESGGNTATITRAGADTIDAGTTKTLATANPVRRLQSDGVSAWTSV